MKRLTMLALVIFAASASDLSAQSAPLASEARIRAGDLLRLRIWREPDLSGEIPVHADGSAVLPRIGPTPVAGRTAEELRSLIQRELSTVLRDPTVDLAVLRRVRVLGAVGTPGLYSLEATMTVADALALAGGVNMSGRRDRIEMVRDGQRVELRVSPSDPLPNVVLATGDELYVPQRSWIARNYGFVFTALTSAVGVIAALLVVSNN